jgi:hypothetical protein
VQFQIAGLRESALLLYAASQQVIFVFIAIATGALGYVLAARGQRGAALSTWVVSALSLVAVVGSMLRARSLRKTLRTARK